MNRRDFVQNAVAGALVSAAQPSPGGGGRFEDDRHPGGRRLVCRRGRQSGARPVPAGGVCQHAVCRDVHVWPRNRGAAGSRAAAAGSRQAGVRHRHVQGRQLHARASAVLQGHGHPGFPRAGFRRLRRAGGGAAGGPQARHEDDLLVRGRVEPAASRTSRRRRRSASTGSNATTLCFNNPNYRNWLLGAVEDYARSYEIDGIMWGSERQGAFANALGASHGGGGGGVARTTCFCQFCEAKAKARGIDPARARAGFQALARIRAGQRGRASGRWTATMSRCGA